MTWELTHPALETRANKVRAAAEDRDLPRLHRELSGLLEAFVEHAEEERDDLRQLPAFSARLVERGQQRILDELLALTVEADVGDRECHCEALGSDVAVRLELQADAERRAFAGVAPGVDGLPE